MVSVEERMNQFHRFGPFALLFLSTVIAYAAAPVVMNHGAEKIAVGVLVAVTAALHLVWNRAGRGRPQFWIPGRVYYVVRTVLTFTLTWLNPFFAIYASLGYVDTPHLLPPKAVRIGLLVTAVTLAGSQSGGLPPKSLMNWVVFGILFFVNASVISLFQHLGAREAETAKDKEAAIAALEEANARLEQTLAENAGLHEQLLLQAREAGVSDERRRLAAEIHDTIAQGLTGIIAQLQVVTSTTDPDTAAVHLSRAQDLARTSLGEARRSVQNLGPAALEHDSLTEALKKTVAVYAQHTGIRAEFTVTGTEEPLHDEVAATLLRIAQEALTNTSRHARATRAGVTLSYMDDEVALDVRDDGTGFDPSTVAARTEAGGFGLDGMRTRAERIAGTVTIESEPGFGTAVSARVPLLPHA
ncbi:sensor histidine kinase [Streptomyces sp. NPDC054863]